MPRTRNVPCRSCGALLWSSASSRANGYAECRACRHVAVVKRQQQPCPTCGTPFVSTNATHRRCSRTCGPLQPLRNGEPRPCAKCAVGQALAPRRWCDPCRSAARRAHYRRKNAVRRGALKVGATLTIEQLGDRDCWTCHLCRRRVGRTFKAPHPRSATFDHLIPISAGGTDAPENLRLAHWGCNSRRGAGGTVQLLLVG